VGLQAPGTCVLVATAVDGRKSVQTAEVYFGGSGPCGASLTASPVTFAIPPLPDAATSDGGGDSDNDGGGGGGDL